MVQCQLKVRAWDWVFTFHPIYLKADRGSLESETSLVYLESSRLARAKINETTTKNKTNSKPQQQQQQKIVTAYRVSSHTALVIWQNENKNKT